MKSSYVNSMKRKRSLTVWYGIQNALIFLLKGEVILKEHGLS
jgi:hypothetical protein